MIFANGTHVRLSAIEAAVPSGKDRNGRPRFILHLRCGDSVAVTGEIPALDETSASGSPPRPYSPPQPPPAPRPPEPRGNREIRIVLGERELGIAEEVSLALHNLRTPLETAGGGLQRMAQATASWVSAVLTPRRLR